MVNDFITDISILTEKIIYLARETPADLRGYKYLYIYKYVYDSCRIWF